ncbi:hypothetical protein AVEN_18462-1 [Araneus ventricosus]|uniref:Uncharacterized protein n=1 Tax=Araneus ventricosus TaxID=182803 RepID=A0A4Y2S149_ARAVE|nr:hypothetical protein AVEN_18462-1 [Araneus ventricosus]
MEIIRCKIVQILPSLQSNIQDSLIKLLEDIGVTAEDELKYVQESDLTAILRPIQARKLIDAWTQLDELYVVVCMVELKSKFFFPLWFCEGVSLYMPPLPTNLPKLNRITEAVTDINEDMLVKTWEETAYKLDLCRVINGAHIEHF